MLGYTQKKMGKILGVSEVTYRNKEKGKIPFKDFEMEIFLKRLNEEIDSKITISEVFFK